MTGTPPAAVDLRDARILVVDDNRINRQLLAAVLQRAGIGEIVHAGDGFEALDRLAVERFDLVLLDLMMPRLDGYEVCRQIRADPRHSDLPVLVQSSLSSSEDRARAFTVGATDFVTKPINATELLSRVRIRLENRLLLADLQHYRQRREAQLELARSMQERLLPQPGILARAERDLGLRIAGHFAPSSELGGDFWGLRPDPQGRLVLWLIDFSGHGVAAALNTFRLHAILHQMDLADFDPAEHLREVNEKLCPLLKYGQFATMLVGLADPQSGRFRYASAGAPPPMVWEAGNPAPRFGPSSGLPVGILPSARYENRELPLLPGGRLFLYSDGASELWTPEGMLGEEGLAAIVAGLGALDGAAFLGRLIDRLTVLGPLTDDLTAVLVSRDDPRFAFS